MVPVLFRRGYVLPVDFIGRKASRVVDREDNEQRPKEDSEKDHLKRTKEEVCIVTALLDNDLILYIDDNMNPTKDAGRQWRH